MSDEYAKLKQKVKSLGRKSKPAKSDKAPDSDGPVTPVQSSAASSVDPAALAAAKSANSTPLLDHTVPIAHTGLPSESPSRQAAHSGPAEPESSYMTSSTVSTKSESGDLGSSGYVSVVKTAEQAQSPSSKTTRLTETLHSTPIKAVPVPAGLQGKVGHSASNSIGASTGTIPEIATTTVSINSTAVSSSERPAPVRSLSALSVSKTSSAHRTRAPLPRTNSLAQLAREHRHRSNNDTRAFYNEPSSSSHTPTHSLSRNASFVRLDQDQDELALDYFAPATNKNVRRENSNLLYRTGSRIQFDTNQFSAWHPESSSRLSSRRNSVGSLGGSDSDSDAEGEDVILHAGRRFRLSRRSSAVGEFDEDQTVVNTELPRVDDEDWDSFANSRLIRVTDWFLGLPSNSPNSLQDLLNSKRKPMDPLEKRRHREQSLVGDPAWIMALAVVVKDFLSL